MPRVTRSGVCDSSGVLEKFKLSIARPSEFFKRVKSEKGFECTVKYYLFLLLIQTVIINSLLVIIPAGFSGCLDCNMVNPFIGALIMQNLRDLFMVNFSVILSVVFTFGAALFVHMFVRLHRGRGGADDTFKALVYSYTPNVVLTILILAIVLGGIGIAAAFPTLPVATWIITAVPLVSLPFILWSAYLGVRGIAAFHSISCLRALSSLGVSLVAVFAVFLLAVPLFSVVLGP